MTGKHLRSGTGDLRNTPRTQKAKAKPAARAVGAAACESKGGDDGPPTMDNVSASLRLAYQTTLDEAIPDEMLDLLRKLD